MNKLTEKAILSAKQHSIPDAAIMEMLTRAPYLLTWAETDQALVNFNRKYGGKYVVGATTGRLTDRTNVQSPEEVEAAVLGSNYTPKSVKHSVLKGFALEVSRKKKNKKFTKYSSSFTKGIEADVENILRGIGGKPDPEDDLGGDYDFLNRSFITPKILEQFNKAIRRIVFRKVKNYPSCGKTLK